MSKCNNYLLPALFVLLHMMLAANTYAATWNCDNPAYLAKHGIQSSNALCLDAYTLYQSNRRESVVQTLKSPARAPQATSQLIGNPTYVAAQIQAPQSNPPASQVENTDNMQSKLAALKQSLANAKAKKNATIPTATTQTATTQTATTQTNTIRADATRVKPASKLSDQPAKAAPATPLPGQDINRLYEKDREVLLKHRAKQMSIGFTYSSNENKQSLRETRSKQISMPLSFSLGLTDLTNLSISAPYNYASRELVSTSDALATTESGMGDVSLGFSRKLFSESRSKPGVTLSLGFGAPTGKQADPANINSLSLGSGFWSTNTGISVSKSFDPAVLFFNLSYQYVLPDKQYGQEVAPGDSFEYSYGIGLSLNNSISVSSHIAGSVQSDTKLDSLAIPGSGTEPMQFVTSSTLRLSPRSSIETNLSIGLNGESDDARLGLSFVRNL